MEIFLVEISGSAVRAFTNEAQAKLYVSCLMSEWDDELDEPRYYGHDIDIVPSYLEK